MTNSRTWSASRRGPRSGILAGDGCGWAGGVGAWASRGELAAIIPAAMRAPPLRKCLRDGFIGLSSFASHRTGDAGPPHGPAGVDPVYAFRPMRRAGAGRYHRSPDGNEVRAIRALGTLALGRSRGVAR